MQQESTRKSRYSEQANSLPPHSSPGILESGALCLEKQKDGGRPAQEDQKARPCSLAPRNLTPSSPSFMLLFQSLLQGNLAGVTSTTGRAFKGGKMPSSS